VETLTKPEQEHVERMSEPFADSSMQGDFEKWAARVVSHGKQEQKERQKNSGPREIKMAGRSEEEREFIEKVAQKDESAKDSKSAADKDAAKAAEHPNAKESEKPGEKSAASEPNNSPSEPISGDRHWDALEGRVHFSEKEMRDHWNNVNSRAGLVLDYISQHPQKAQIEQGFAALMAGRPKGQGLNEPFFRDLSMALAEVPNPGEVFRHITLKAEDREFVRRVKNWKELRAAIHTVSKHYLASAPQASPKPRAPRPPTEVGGRGAVGDDGTRGDGDFSSFSRNMNQRYGRR
jgi:hypothetical protein